MSDDDLAAWIATALASPHTRDVANAVLRIVAERDGFRKLLATYNPECLRPNEVRPCGHCGKTMTITFSPSTFGGKTMRAKWCSPRCRVAAFRAAKTLAADSLR